jgi:ferredoxin
MSSLHDRDSKNLSRRSFLKSSLALGSGACLGAFSLQGCMQQKESSKKIEPAATTGGGTLNMVAVDLTACHACGSCVEACEFGAIQMQTRTSSDPKSSVLTYAINSAKCTACGECVSVCPASPIAIQKSGAGYATVRKNCTGCGNCAAACKFGAVAKVNEKPVTNSKCTLCLKCVAACPRDAISKPD